MESSRLNNLIQDFLRSHKIEEPSNIQIVLPRTPLPLTNSQLQQLTVTFDVLKESAVDGLDIFVDILRFVRNCIN